MRQPLADHAVENAIADIHDVAACLDVCPLVGAVPQQDGILESEMNDVNAVFWGMSVTVSHSLR
jgi:hypothetical protein